MNEHDFTTNTPFSTVGALKELLRIYPDNTPLYVCGVGGVFCPNEEEQCILLESDSCRYEGVYGHCGDDGYLEF